LGDAIPGNFMGIRCSEIVPQNIFGQKQSHSGYMAFGVLYPIFGCPYMYLLSQLTSNFHERKYQGWQNSRWGDIMKDNW